VNVGRGGKKKNRDIKTREGETGRESVYTQFVCVPAPSVCVCVKKNCEKK
jgi:hypothetical protein